jgi:acetyl esterase/lipase
MRDTQRTHAKKGPLMGEDILDLPAPPADARLAYGADTLLFGDLRLPSGAGPHPVAVVIHGGFWRARYDLTHIGHLCAALTTAGVATWNLEYRRIGDRAGGWPNTFLDVAAGTDYLRTLANRYPINLTRVVAIGHSAGGHLAAWLGGRNRVAAESPMYAADPLPLRGVVPLAGVLDLRRAWELRLSSGVVRDLLGGTPERYPERYAAASPAELLPLGVRQTVIHGTADDTVPYAISRAYVEAAQAAGDPAELVTLPNAGHFELIDPRAEEWPRVRDAVLALLE